VAIIVEVDWERDGFEGSWDVPYDDIYLDTEPGGSIAGTDTDWVRPYAQAVNVEYGRDQSTALSPTVAGRGGFTLDNTDRRYSPRNTLSPLYGYLKPARPVRISRTVPTTDGYPEVYSDSYTGEAGTAAYILFAGHTDDSPINPDLDSRTVALSLVDSLADMRGLNVSTGLYRDIRTGTAIGYVLDACGWPAELRDLDFGATIIPWWWEDGTDALTALENILRSEGPPAMLTVGTAGEIIFRDRHHRLTRAPSLTTQDTWHASGSVEPIMARGFSYDEAWRNIVNTGTAAVDVRMIQPRAVVWTSEATVTLAAGEQRIITAASTEPFLNARTPSESGGDYTLVSGTVTVRLIRTSGVSTGIELTADPSNPVVMTGLRLRAQPVTVAYTTQVTASDAESIGEYGSRSFPGDLPWCGIYDAQAVLETAVSLRAEPLPIVSARFMIGTNTERVTAILPRDLSDRVTVIEPETALAGDFYVESIAHEITRHETDHSVTFGLEAVPGAYAVDTGFGDIFEDTFTGITSTILLRFDTAGAGFGDGAFGSGLVIASEMFRFDNAQGFDLAGFAK
jgi:hypothetical protein